MLGLSEGVTEEILTRELERLGGGVKRGVEFVDLEADDKAIRVRVRENGVERILEPSWLVGADGFHSMVRDAVGIEFPGHDYDQQWGVADVRFANWPHEPDLAAAMFDPLLIPVPIGGNIWRAYFRADPAVSAHQIHIAHCLEMLAPGTTVASSDEPQLLPYPLPDRDAVPLGARVARRRRGARLQPDRRPRDERRDLRRVQSGMEARPGRDRQGSGRLA